MISEADRIAAVQEAKRIFDDEKAILTRPKKLLEKFAQKTMTLVYEARDFVMSFKDEDAVNEEVPPAIVVGLSGAVAECLLMSAITAFTPVDSTVVGASVVAGGVIGATFGAYLGYKDYNEPPEKNFASD